ncbi:carbohydrate porin [Sphingomonas sanguinis]|uniref:Carbohydrate porin n=1 Tax=Sphingomonas sanguinis TaxID=33051 RepID=A0ABU5LPE9_9SPHN|nr:carbohydrate porin [Sphingomonas sanguinis]MDZ7281809.1 carbohydrate porin [Sphingomonas sanguinis]
MTLRQSIMLLAVPMLAILPSPVLAQEEEPRTETSDEGEDEKADAFSLDLLYKADLVGVAAGGGARGARFLDNVDVMASIDLDRAAGWHGTSAYVGVLSNAGARPNDIAGTLQGVNNIEVGSPDLLLYQAWVQQRFAGDRGSVLVGKYDLNSEFYANPAAAALIAPAFGIGSELAATGPNGPSIFPQTDLAIRVRMEGKRHYVQAAVIRAPRGVADEGGPRSALMIAEAGIRGRTAITVGGWTYTDRQQRIVPPGITLGPDTAISHGLYALVEQDLVGEAGKAGHWTAFLRAGLSDGLTTPFGDGMQVGVTGYGVLPSRPDSLVSIGFATAGLSRAYRRANPPEEAPLTRSESTFELTYSDRVARFLTLQPDVQYVHRPAGLRDAPGVVVLGLRAIVDWKIH